MSMLDDETLRRLHHDIRSPLVVISGFAALLSSDDREIADADRVDYARRIARAADDLRELVDGALEEASACGRRET